VICLSPSQPYCELRSCAAFELHGALALYDRTPPHTRVSLKKVVKIRWIEYEGNEYHDTRNKFVRCY
jgi:hypothetical protein